MTSDRHLAIAKLRAVFGDRLSTGDSIRDLHGRDASRFDVAPPDAVVFPETTAEVARVVSICAEHACPIVPFGVGSSLEGHVIPVHGGVSVDTSRMSRVLDVQPENLCAVVQPGVTREQLAEERRATGLMFTVDPGANATLGGMAATRASGTNTVRYGTMADTVLALEVVTADARVIRTGCLSALKGRWAL
ncbi:FAD-binding oxidoreductase [Tropicibacter sp. Alg240-R139]|uniref:FAD-binding oxidoreductase n=1 Tax=Tropicibacter sp. Alg240-R139 TaxID=2305991 RepID=UPI001F07C540|nr:FAD-binding oxidoreductase [Tropicibacter sp. Alg240-R139]